MISKSLIKKNLKQVTLTNIDIVTGKILNKMGGGGNNKQNDGEDIEQNGG